MLDWASLSDQEKAAALAVLDDDDGLSEEDVAVPCVACPSSQSFEDASLVIQGSFVRFGIYLIEPKRCI